MASVFQRCCDRRDETRQNVEQEYPFTPREAVTRMTALSLTPLMITNLILGLLLTVMTLLFIFRIVLTWYPQVEMEKMPFRLAIVPTEPFLAPTRKLVPPLGGVDISPIIWVGLFSLIREVLLGQQGILTMLAR
jgi:YggT family protein